MIKPKTEKQVKAIVKNVVAACHNINKLNKIGYDYIYLCSGFIAHYNLGGFIDYYSDNVKLTHDILEYQSMNKWTNFHPGDENYEYYHQKGEIYAMIVAELAKERLFV